uniref:Uncharacterized protein n=1 Tax=Siphoviridae sp. ctqPo10 TaxID=2827948 RepID=A0A8S5SVS0_9CAUD|nr:MAG TPA: hypothetical protein [Siphoviridae sp. ctqPo10]
MCIITPFYGIKVNLLQSVICNLLLHKLYVRSITIISFIIPLLFFAVCFYIP